MIIYGENKIVMFLSEIGIDVANAIKYDRTKGSDEFALDLPFANNDLIMELLKEDIEALAMENGYYGIDYKTDIQFVYFFGTDKAEVAIWIEPVNETDKEFLEENMSVTFIEAELNATDKNYLCMCLAEIIYNA